MSSFPKVSEFKRVHPKTVLCFQRSEIGLSHISLLPASCPLRWWRHFSRRSGGALKKHFSARWRVIPPIGRVSLLRIDIKHVHLPALYPCKLSVMLTGYDNASSWDIGLSKLPYSQFHELESQNNGNVKGRGIAFVFIWISLDLEDHRRT